MIEIRKFEPDDTDAAVKIWNEVVDDGIAFPQLDDLDHESGLAFFEEQTSLLILIQMKLSDFIFYIQIILEDAAISVMQVMRFLLLTEENRLVNSWSLTV